MIQCQFHSKTDSTVKPSKGFNVNPIQRQIQPLKSQIGFKVNSIQRWIQPSMSIAFKDGFNH